MNFTFFRRRVGLQLSGYGGICSRSWEQPRDIRCCKNSSRAFLGLSEFVQGAETPRKWWNSLRLIAAVTATIGNIESEDAQSKLSQIYILIYSDINIHPFASKTTTVQGAKNTASFPNEPKDNKIHLLRILSQSFQLITRRYRGSILRLILGNINLATRFILGNDQRS